MLSLYTYEACFAFYSERDFRWLLIILPRSSLRNYYYFNYASYQVPFMWCNVRVPLFLMMVSLFTAYDCAHCTGLFRTRIPMLVSQFEICVSLAISGLSWCKLSWVPRGFLSHLIHSLFIAFRLVLISGGLLLQMVTYESHFIVELRCWWGAVGVKGGKWRVQGWFPRHNVYWRPATIYHSISFSLLLNWHFAFFLI